ncbi:MAG: beta-propeller fold lactonase family protein [Granulosicoccus sp.]
MTRIKNMNRLKKPLALSLITASMIIGGCSDNSIDSSDNSGGVFVMSNILEGNTIVAYQRANNGKLTLAGEFATGGLGGDFDGGEGLDPLISAYSLLNTPENDYLLAVNAGSNTVSVMRINQDMTLELSDTESTNGTGPNSIAYKNGYVYVTNIDSDGVFTGEPDQEGSITGYTFSNGDLSPLENSTRNLPNRPSAIRFSPDGNFLITSSVNAGSAALTSGNDDSLLVFGIDESGIPTEAPLSGASSTITGNAESRNLPTSIGFDVVERSDSTFVVATEAREFRPEGQPPLFSDLQTGSVSVFQLGDDGVLSSSQLDLFVGQSATIGQRTSCWIVVSPVDDYFWVSNAVDATISSFQFTDASANIELLQDVAAAGTPPASLEPDVTFDTTDGFIDLDISDDGRYLYQLYGLSGVVGVFAVDGGNLNLVEEISGNLPERDTQGIVAF